MWWWRNKEIYLNVLIIFNGIILWLSLWECSWIFYLEKALIFVVVVSLPLLIVLGNQYLIHRNITRRRRTTKYLPPLSPKVLADVLILAWILVIIYLPTKIKTLSLCEVMFISHLLEKLVCCFPRADKEAVNGFESDQTLG